MHVLEAAHKIKGRKHLDDAGGKLVGTDDGDWGNYKIKHKDRLVLGPWFVTVTTNTYPVECQAPRSVGTDQEALGSSCTPFRPVNKNTGVNDQGQRPPPKQKRTDAP